MNRSPIDTPPAIEQSIYPMQAYTFHRSEYFFFLILVCTMTTSLANISPFYHRTKPLRLMDMILAPNSLGKYIGHMLTAVRGISHVNGFQNLLTRSIQQSLERQAKKTEHRETQQNTVTKPATVKPSRRRYDHNCFFNPVNCVNLPRKLSHLKASAIKM
ncbi:hypothetical protein DdX_13759 [Ditylenchus destructor]|uniref:Uncharacterized protein n=1 Tax=Ditylenchus destructor TaxID=166010 RepID=A0AAD4MVY6_9BILA|nr:hypothetical protein DdX_13759 [Ditylenchus destructor]